jgi:His/Glu/Gln/Arg/opine family amino acid ABC transporter permease subunit
MNVPSSFSGPYKGTDVSGYQPDWGLVADNLDRLMAGLGLLLLIAAFSYAMAMTLGLVFTLMRSSSHPILRIPAAAVVEGLRSIPLFLFLFLVYYGAPQVSPLVLSAFVAAVVALGLTGAAYASEIYRGALLGVDEGQWEAADALGLSPSDRLRFVVLPQAFRIAIPPALNLLVALLKGATFVSVIGVADMFYVSRDISLQFFAPFELYTFSGLTIIAVTLTLAGAVAFLERHLDRSD